MFFVSETKILISKQKQPSGNKLETKVRFKWENAKANLSLFIGFGLLLIF